MPDSSNEFELIKPYKFIGIVNKEGNVDVGIYDSYEMAISNTIELATQWTEWYVGVITDSYEDPQPALKRAGLASWGIIHALKKEIDQLNAKISSLESEKEELIKKADFIGTSISESVLGEVQRQCGQLPEQVRKEAINDGIASTRLFLNVPIVDPFDHPDDGDETI